MEWKPQQAVKVARTMVPVSAITVKVFTIAFST
jgi:hypothetical protein